MKHLILTVLTCFNLFAAPGVTPPQANGKDVTGHNDVRWYGAVGDGAADDTAAIQACADYLATTANGGLNGVRPEIYFPPSAGWKTTSTITINEGITVRMDSPIVSTVTNGPSLVIGRAGQANCGVRLQVRVRKSTQSDWSNEANVGIKIINGNACNIELNESRNATIGVQMLGDGQGCAYNTVRIGYLNNNCIGLDLATANTNGYCNQNIFHGGRFGEESGIGTGHARYGVRIKSLDGIYFLNNANVFYGPSFELRKSEAGSADAIPWLVVDGVHNYIYDARDEGNDLIFARFQNGSFGNFATVSYESNPNPAFSNEGDYSNNGVQFPLNLLGDRSGQTIFESGAVHKLACYANGSNTVNVPGLHIANSANTNIASSMNGFALNSNYLQIGSNRAIGILVDTSLAKRFLVQRDSETNNAGRLLVRCYDATGNVYTNSDAFLPNYNPPFKFVTTWGGVFGTTSDHRMDAIFQVGPNVKTIAVMCAVGSAPCRIRSFKILSLDNSTAACYPGYEQVVAGANIGTAYPTTGDFKKGRMIWNSNQSPTAPIGWVCIADSAGSNGGTWKQFVGGGGYSITLPMDTFAAPAARKTYYMGADTVEMRTTYANASVRIPKGGLLRNVYIKVNVTGKLASNEAVAHYLRVNDTTDVTIGNLTYNANVRDISTNTSIPVQAGDSLAVKIVTPAWITNPTNVRWWASLYIE